MQTKLLIALFVLLSAVTLTLAVPRRDRNPAYGILLDNSGSLRTQLPQMKVIAKALVERIHQRGPVSLFTFVRQGGVLVPNAEVEWTQDNALLRKYVDGISVAAGRTILIDSVEAIAERLDTMIDAKKTNYSGKVLILITDGEDRSSQTTQKRLIEQLQKNGFKVYAIGLVDELEDKPSFIRKGPKESAVQLLTHVTKQTGGRVVFPRGKLKVDAILDELFGV